MMQPTLADIIQTHNLVTDKNSLHSYCEHFYEKELQKYRNRPVTLVEVGIDQGGSLMLWAEYFSRCQILGVDLQLRGDCEKNCARYPNIRLSLGNAYMYESIPCYPDMDIFIDDGPHDPGSQVWAVKNISHRIKPGGLFVIEDVADVDTFSVLKDATPYHLRDHVECIDLRWVKNRGDDLLFVIRIPETGDAPADVNHAARPGLNMMTERLSHLKNIIDFNDIKNIIDVGSAHGYESLNLASFFPNARVFGFEPLPEHYQHCLKVKAQYVEIGNRLHFENIALNDVNGPIRFYPLDPTRSRGNNTGMASKFKIMDASVFPHELNIQQETIVNAVQLDYWCERQNIVPDMIWMDAQGAELDILKGAAKSLESVKVILTEVGVKPYYTGHTLKPDIDLYLQSKGFEELVSARNLGHEYEMDTIYIKKSP